MIIRYRIVKYRDGTYEVQYSDYPTNWTPAAYNRFNTIEEAEAWIDSHTVVETIEYH